MKYISFLLTCLLLVSICIAQPIDPAQFPGKMSKWHRFTRYDFQYDCRDCHIIVPDKSAPGKPWIWRARFPECHYEIDSMLINNGFYVVYINTEYLFESPVCDIKSWPGGKLTAQGNSTSWRQLKIAYNFKTYNEAIDYSDNPSNNLGKLAGAKVPVGATVLVRI